MPELNYTDAELKALKNQYAKQASQEQFDLWIAECRTRGLVPVKDVVLQMRATKEYNPETRQKEFVKKAVHITTIQALRKLAERTGKYAGQLPSMWIYLDATGTRVESDIPLPESNGSAKPRIPWAAKVSVLRKGFDHPIIVPARFEAYAQYFSDGSSQQLNSTWANRGPEQLEKCAEALALRKAFPEELGGLYLQEEFTDEETVQATAQPSTENGVNAAPSPATTQGTLPEKKRKKKESVPDAGKPWGGLAGNNAPNLPENTTVGNSVLKTDQSVSNGQNIHGLDIKDEEIPFPGDPEPEVQKTDRLATDLERTGFQKRLVALRDKGYDGPALRAYLLKETGVAASQLIPLARFTELVDRLESAEKSGNLKSLLEGK